MVGGDVVEVLVVSVDQSRSGGFVAAGFDFQRTKKMQMEWIRSEDFVFF